MYDALRRSGAPADQVRAAGEVVLTRWPVSVYAGLLRMAMQRDEFTRKGRIDEIYGIYLPTHDERLDILRIHLQLKNRNADGFDLDGLAGATEGYTGADIREVVLTGLKIAFHAGQELNTEHLLEAVPEIRPLSKTDPERVAVMTEWLDRHTKAAAQRETGNMGNLCGLKRTRPVAV